MTLEERKELIDRLKMYKSLRDVGIRSIDNIYEALSEQAETIDYIVELLLEQYE